jgi:diaminopimelate epimerase
MLFPEDGMPKLEIPFTKLNGAGNDFVAVNNISGALHVDWSAFARTVSDRHFGVGADGLLVLEPSGGADFTMLYFNADGSTGGMCGNGGRCCVMLARHDGITKDNISFEAFGFTYRAEKTEEGISVAMKPPEKLRRGIPVHLSAGRFLCHAIDTGAPHVVTFVDDLEKVDVVATGRELRVHREFRPEGTNVNFVKIEGKNEIAIRTYERGVEAETMACGTGSIASAVITALERGATSPVAVHTRSGETLRVRFTRDGQHITSVSLEGHARIVFSASLLYNTESNKIEAQHEV